MFVVSAVWMGRRKGRSTQASISKGEGKGQGMVVGRSEGAVSREDIYGCAAVDTVYGVH